MQYPLLNLLLLAILVGLTGRLSVAAEPDATFPQWEVDGIQIRTASHTNHNFPDVIKGYMPIPPPELWEDGAQIFLFWSNTENLPSPMRPLLLSVHYVLDNLEEKTDTIQLPIANLQVGCSLQPCNWTMGIVRAPKGQTIVAVTGVFLTMVEQTMQVPASMRSESWPVTIMLQPLVGVGTLAFRDRWKEKERERRERK